MTPQELITELRRSGITLWIDEDGALRYRAPPGALSDDLRSLIRNHRSALVAWLSVSPGTAVESVPDILATLEQDLPFTPNQIWYLETVRPQDVDWSNIVSWQFRSPVSPIRLEQALAVLHDRYDLFRLRRYRQTDGSWAQRMIANADPLPIEMLDLQSTADAIDQRETLVQLGRRCQSRISCVRGPILAMGVILSKHRTQDQGVIATHHFDAFSIALFLSELLQVYSQLERGEPIRLPQKSVGYSEYLSALSARSHQSSFLSAQRKFWLNPDRLAPVPSIPRDHPVGDHFVIDSRLYELSFSSELRDKMASFVLSHDGVQFMDLVLFGLCRAFGQWSSGQPLYLDIEHHGRTAILPGVDLARTLGPTTVKVPVRFDTAQPVDDLLALDHVHKTHQQTMEHASGYGYLRYCRPDPTAASILGAQPAPEVLLNNRSTLPTTVLESVTNLGGEPEWLPNPEQNRVTYTLIVECERSPESLSLVFRYSRRIHEEMTIKRFAHATLSSISALLSGAGSS